MPMNYYIVTGSSRGIGAELSRQLLKEDHHVICVSRTENEEIAAFAHANNYRYNFLPFDLNHISGLGELTMQIFKLINEDETRLVCLINNAAVVTPLGQIDQCHTDEIIASVHTNLLSPMILTSNLLAATKDWRAERKVINISSGSGKYPAAGMSVYCATKAAVDMFTKCADLEHKAENGRVCFHSVDPGMVDTQMQATARNADASFQMKSYFAEAKDEGRLKRPDEVARKIIRHYLK